MAIDFHNVKSGMPHIRQHKALGGVNIGQSVFDKFQIGGKSLKAELNINPSDKQTIFAETKKQANMPVNDTGFFANIKNKINMLPLWGKVGLGLGFVIGAGLIIKGGH